MDSQQAERLIAAVEESNRLLSVLMQYGAPASAGVLILLGFLIAGVVWQGMQNGPWK